MDSKTKLTEFSENRIFGLLRIVRIFGESKIRLDSMSTIVINSFKFHFEKSHVKCIQSGQTGRLLDVNLDAIYLGMTAIYRYFPLNYNSKNQHSIKYSKPNLE